MPFTRDPMNAIPWLAFKRFGVHSLRPERKGEMNGTELPDRRQSPSHGPLWTCTRLVTTAAEPGQGSFGLAAWMTAPFLSNHSNPLWRVSPSAMVLVASRPKWPPSRSNANARRKKCDTRSAFLLAPACMVTSHSLYAAPMTVLILLPPRNGGLPTKASKPPFSRTNTSGKASGQ